jgi:hypothetical protein
VRSDLVLQPFENDLALIELLRDALASDVYESFTVVVAWARPSGLNLIKDDVQAFRDSGGHTHAIVGIDEGGATVEGLTVAVSMFDVAEVLYDPKGGTFHPKIYLFKGPAEALLVVGSNNLTAGGLYYNYEAAHVTQLDLGLESDKSTLFTVEDYIGRLRDDDTCLDLTSELINELAADPRLRVSREADRRQGKPKEDSVAEETDEGSELPFAGSKYRRKAIKTSVKKIPPSKPVPGAKEVGGSTASVVARWSKKLTRSDCGQPTAGSHTTGALRFTKAGHPIDQATWFRSVLFASASWDADPTRFGRERAQIRFEVIVDGVNRGTHVLQLKYDAVRDAGQRNFTTDLKWGSATPVIIANNLVGEYVTVEHLADDSFRLSIDSADPAPFVDLLAADAGS